MFQILIYKSNYLCIEKISESKNEDFEILLFGSEEDLMQKIKSSYRSLFFILFDMTLQNQKKIVHMVMAIHLLNLKIPIIITSEKNKFRGGISQLENIHCLAKPIDQLEFSFILQSIKRKWTNNRISFPSKNKKHLIIMDEIIWIERNKRYSYAYLIDGSILCISETLSEIIKRLDQTYFIRCHQSYILNLAYVDKFTFSGFIIKNYYGIFYNKINEKNRNPSNWIPISRRYTEPSKCAYEKFVGTYIWN